MKDTDDLKHFHLSRIKSAQSSPLITRSGKLMGMISTHWKTIHEPTERELRLLDVLVRQATDLLERKQSEVALRKSEEKLKNLNTWLEQEVRKRTGELVKQHHLLNQAEELAKGGSWEYNVKTREFIWSDNMYRLFGLPKGETIKPSIYLKHALTEDRAIAKRIITVITESFEPIEKTIRIKFDHSYRSIKVKTAPLVNEVGEVEKMLGVDLDISEIHRSADKIMKLDNSLLEMNKELKLANRELQYSNDQVTRLNESVLKMNSELNSANAELRNFSSITANNYTEALRHVYINLESIVTADARNLSNSSRANLRRAQAAVQKMKLLTGDIHNYLQLYETGIRKQMTDINGIIADVANKLKTKIEESHAQISPGVIPKMLVDPELFSRLLTNLIDNAIKFRKPDVDPVVRINYSLIRRSRNLPDRKPHEPYFIIEVADNGIGLENTEKIFELFSQLQEQGKYKGAGMGLPICKKIMEMHGGFITATSRPGEGSIFSCFFPAGF
jgi:signal transduction histidine kinase